MDVDELDCGCEIVLPPLSPVSWCGEHAGGIGIQGADPERVFRCGECGFATQRWERLEGHFYREHLGVRCG
jgi:hypothetical protein